jgi:hypothetical protein
MGIGRREFIAGAAGLVLAGAADPPGALTPEAFGARGDGRTNDTDAFAALSRAINSAGGGTVVLRPVTYVVGKQLAPTAGPLGFAFTPAPVLRFVGCRYPVAVRGNGAVLRAAPGLRFGSFDPRSGAPIERGKRFYDRGYRASPYEAMISAERCSGGVAIADVELDGNLQALAIGGHWGDIDWQLPGTGVLLTDNDGPETIDRVHSHHHPLDGIMINGPSQRAASSSISDVRCDSNGRQGCSVVGGRNYVFQRCRFERSGKGGLSSSPGAGVDIEAEQKTVRNLRFSACEFVDNSGPGLSAPAGDSEGATFDSCTFVGTTNWSAWPDKPGFRFSDCMFVGAMVHAHGDPDPEKAAHFANCRFRDDPALSPTGVVFGNSGEGKPIVDLYDGRNSRFDQCNFQLSGAGLLPWSIREVIYSNCSMEQRSPLLSHPRGTFLGTNRIDGHADLSGSLVDGTLVLNGRTVPPGPIA